MYFQDYHKKASFNHEKIYKNAMLRGSKMNIYKIRARGTYISFHALIVAD